MSDSPSRTFLLVAFGFSWLVALVLAFIGDFTSPVIHAVGGFIFMCGPALGAVVAWKVHCLPNSAFGLTMPNLRWMFFAWLTGVFIVASSMLLSLLLPGATFVAPGTALLALLPPEEVTKLTTTMPEPTLSLALVLQALVMGPVFNLPMMLSEELGWRGVWWSRTESLSFWRRAAVIGFVWGLWHAPLIAMGHNYPGHPVLGVLLMIVFCMLLTVPMHSLRQRGGSVWVACMFHGTINALATLSVVCVSGTSPLIGGVPGLVGCGVLSMCCVMVWQGRRRLGL